MSVILYLIPLAFFIGLFWLFFFVWTIRSKQYEDLDGAARRILMDDDKPLPEKRS